MMWKRWNGIAALAVGATILSSGAVSAAQIDTANGSPRPLSALAFMRSSVESLAGFVGIEDPTVAPGTIDDGKELLPLATITLDAAIAAAQASGPGSVGEVDLEYYKDTLVFNVDVGDKDVKIDAATGALLGVESDD